MYVCIYCVCMNVHLCMCMCALLQSSPTGDSFFLALFVWVGTWGDVFNLSYGINARVIKS